ncbi:diacylglycerol kinase family lipid kinase [bacterium]|nr:diacylglycerol kinase family lipid kinase [bacterium]
MQLKRIHVIINPAAGTESPVLFRMNQAFRKHGIKWDVSITHEAGDAEAAARKAVNMGVDAVVGYGGDGTMMEIANCLAHTDMPMGILPGGTANVLSQELQIPQNLTRSLRALCSENHEIRKFDMGRIDNHVFLLNLGIGVPAQWIKHTDRDMKNRFGILAYIISAIRATRFTKPSTFHMVLDGRKIQADGVACMVANIGATGVLGFKLSEYIKPDDGYMDVLIINLSDLPLLLSASTNALLSEKRDIDSAFKRWKAREIYIEADPVQPVNIDGEIIHDTPVSITTIPQAVNVIAPPPELRVPRHLLANIINPIIK